MRVYLRGGKLRKLTPNIFGGVHRDVEAALDDKIVGERPTPKALKDR